MKKLIIIVLSITALWFIYNWVSQLLLPKRDAHIAVESATANIHPAILPQYISASFQVRIQLPNGLIRGETVSTQLPNAFLVDDLSYSLTKTLKQPPSLLEYIPVAISYFLTGAVDTRAVMRTHIVEVATTNTPKAKFDIDIYSAQFDDVKHKSNDRHGQRVTAKLKGKDIAPGGEIIFTYSTTTPWITSKAFPVKVMINGTQIAQNPTIEIPPGPPASLQVIVPSSAKPGQSFTAKLISRDQFDNLATTAVNGITLTLDDKLIQDNISVSGRKDIELSITEPGIYRLKAGDILSNPIRISNNPQGPWWGDLHTHNYFSADAHSSHTAPDHYTYAKDVSALDFVALTNHIFGLESDYWQKTMDMCKQYNKPGEFVTILAFEGGFGYHLDGYYPTCEGPVIDSQRHGSGSMNKDNFEKYQQIVDQEDMAIAIHHTGISWGGASFDGSDTFPGQLQHIEVFSAHGQSEYYAPEDPLSYENSKSSPGSSSSNGPHYARDAWANGFKFYTLAASDDHNGQPGKRANGLAAITAPVLERSALLENFEAGNIYGTTGERILLDFSINNTSMGNVIDVAEGQPLNFTIEVHGTGELAHIKVYRYQFGSNKGWETIFNLTGQLGMDVNESWTEASVGHAVYYAVVEQVEPIRVLLPVLQDRPVRAWSSPIWNGEPQTNFE